VDDHPIVRRGLRALLDAEPDLEVVAEAEDFAGAFAALASARPDVILVDVSLGGSDGLELVQRIRAAHSLPILVLSIHDETLYAERAVRAGANGYVMKHEATRVVVDAIRSVLRGQVWLSERITSRFVRAYLGAPAPEERPLLSCLTDRELQVFHLIAQGLGTGGIAKSLGISRKTVETHRAHIKEKLGLRTGVELVQFAAQFTAKLAT